MYSRLVVFAGTEEKRGFAGGTTELWAQPLIL